MKTFSAIIVAMVTMVCMASAGQLPDANLTPGEADPALTMEVLCAAGFTTKTYRNVDAATKRDAYAAYAMQPNKGACAGKGCEVDHLISLELGGSNGLKNLWPQPYGGPWNAHMKGRLENRLHRLVCAGKLGLQEAQDEIAADLVASYKRQFGAHGGP